eukprot:3413781-Pyramimonas_sp.AAC.1
MYHSSGTREVGDRSPVDVPEDLDRRLAGARVGQSWTCSWYSGGGGHYHGEGVSEAQAGHRG